MGRARWGLAGLVALFASAPAFADSSEPAVPTAWGACPERGEGGRDSGPYLLGRYGDGMAVLEVESSGRAALAKLWSHALRGGEEILWPGGRPGVRHLADPALFAQATPVARAGRVYLWTSANGWNGDVSKVVGVELAKSLCDAHDLVVYAVVRAPGATGSGVAVGRLVAPAAGADSPPSVPADTPRRVLDHLYAAALGELQDGLRSQKITPASLSVNVYPGHFSAKEPQYAVSLRWSNAYDDRFSVLFLADKDGKLSRVIDRQEGGVGGTLVEAADLDGDGFQELFYQVTTLDGSSEALWSLRGGTFKSLVQTTPVGE